MLATLPGVQQISILSLISHSREGQSVEALGVDSSQRSSREGDLAPAQSLLLHQVDWVGVGAPIIIWLVVLSVLGPCMACSSQVADLWSEEKNEMHLLHNLLPSTISS